MFSLSSGLSRRAAIIDLTSDSIVAAKLEEAVVECLETEKDAYLYYLLRLHPSRTIVFCTAISAVRRIAALLQLLQVFTSNLLLNSLHR
jgi:ATP-dependent RNA helicase DDX24/MAK5